jgi:hypothetical protein
MVVQGAFMHVHESLSADRFLKYLAEKAPAGEYFVAQPPPGIIMTAAIDWRVIVKDMETIDVLANALWQGYESFVKPLRVNSFSSPQMLIQLKNAKGEYDQFTLGKDFQKKDGFCHRMRESSAVLITTKKESTALQEMEITEESGYWQKVN